ncbi:putative beta-glucosidase [Medicago truncatula]|uniref:Beta-glucosidase n=1 Tax=Medicago truncatula TaxID=3880 RepID=A8TVR1_MEDTR|nr:beta-glucosidase 42 [Medicago truncatula]ABW76289.1 beta-glucosidase G4 [Medicago truncatula]AES69719.1 glycoside hydrolase family 1 protein [Medicago truncatula]RHN66365.1 putative beta-glucosidase [Medicago truncatula]
MVKKEEFLRENGFEKEGLEEVSRSDFPSDFVFGVATSAYQIEGASKEGGRGPSIWDAYAYTEGKILDKSNGDVAVDHYHRYKEDIDLIAKLGFSAYRFSISWSRIFPDGLGTNVNDEGITFYNNIINALLEKGIQPFVTLYHWDLPLHLEESMGGWLNKKIIEYFAVYADTCFASFGDRVKNWITINEPLQTAVGGYDAGVNAPGRCENRSVEPYLAAHHQILAHAAAVSIYRSKYKDKQGGQVGLVVDSEWAEPNSDKIEDKSAAARHLDFHLGWFLHPLYYGDYPEVMRERLGDQLPKFSEEDKKFLLNSLDFIGLNHYTTRLISHVTESTEECHYDKAQQLDRIVEWEGGDLIGEKAASEWLYAVPWGLRKIINYISQKYATPIYVTENGMDDEDNDSLSLNEMLDDKMRVRYYKGYLASVAQAIKDGADVRGHFAWSLLDNFEWAQGYTKRFGLVYVDYKNGLTRHPKSSAYWFSRFLKDGANKKGKEQ